MERIKHEKVYVDHVHVLLRKETNILLLLITNNYFMHPVHRALHTALLKFYYYIKIEKC